MFRRETSRFIDGLTASKDNPSLRSCGLIIHSVLVENARSLVCIVVVHSVTICAETIVRRSINHLQSS